jgi:ribosomal protein S27AE
MWTCPQCGESHEESFDTCWKCGTGRDGAPEYDPTTFNADSLIVQEQVTARTILCAKCGAVMLPGLLRDASTHAPATWIAGDLDNYPMFRASTTGKPMAVSAYRCGACGYLEFYAH